MEKQTNLNQITLDSFVVHVKTLSPLHLGSGRADINVDADIVHDDLGLPVFPGKRFKGLLAESAQEILEMSDLSGSKLITSDAIKALFGQTTNDRASAFSVQNLYLKDYDELRSDLSYLEQQYPALITSADILEEYTSLRYQTKIDPETGTAATTSLHNMRVLDKGCEFYGTITLQRADLETLKILALSIRNISSCGLKRSRGFGRIECSMEQDGKNISDLLTEVALKEGGLL